MARTLPTLYTFADPRQAALRDRRRRLGLLAVAVAQVLGITQPELSAIENGRRQATPEQLAHLGAILDAYERTHARILRQPWARSAVSA